MDFEGFIETSQGCFIRREHIESFEKLGLAGIDDFLNFAGGEGIRLELIAKFRNRQVFTAGNPPTRFYLKTYNRPPIGVQLSNWLAHGKRASTAAYDYLPALELAKIGIKTPKIAAFGEVWNGIFEQKSFIATEEIVGAAPLENNPPEFFVPPFSSDKRKKKLEFIDRLATFTRKFHGSGFFHRDYYLCHIFWGKQAGFEMIDLQRIFKPILLKNKYRIKDIAQLYYSAPASIYSKADRLRFYKRYADKDKLSAKDKWFLYRVKSKAAKMALHDEKRGRTAPYKS